MRGVIANDAYIHWGGDGRQWFQGIDKNASRMELPLSGCRYPKEGFDRAKAAEDERLRRREERAATEKQSVKNS